MYAFRMQRLQMQVIIPQKAAGMQYKVGWEDGVIGCGANEGCRAHCNAKQVHINLMYIRHSSTVLQVPQDNG